MKNLHNIKIERLGYGGLGIAKLSDGKKLLVKGGALPGCVVDINVTKKHKDYMEGHIVKIHEYDKSYLSNEIFCPHFFSNISCYPQGHNDETSQNINDNNLTPSHIDHNDKKSKIGCGGCKWQMIDYLKQLELKEGIVRDCFRKLEGKHEILPIAGSPKEKGYRNKIEFSFGVYISAKEGIDSRRNIGFHKQGEFSKIIDIDRCGLISEKMNKVFQYIKNLCFESGLPTFDQKFHRGFFRHLVIREGQNTDQLLINLSVFPILESDGENKIKWENFKTLLKNDPVLKNDINTFVVTYNDGLADIVNGQNITNEILWGDGFIYEKLIFPDENGGDIVVNFRVSPFSFFQTNTHCAEKLFTIGAKNIGEIKGNILDLYCGAGSIGISFLKMGIGKKLLGIEIVAEAIQDAWHNAEINGVKGSCNFLASSTEKILLPDSKSFSKNIESLVVNPQSFVASDENLLSEQWLSEIGLVIVDPPREGLHTNVIQWIVNLKKFSNFKLLYISCNPTTMARDCELLINGGFELKHLQPVDMFPHTHHIETVGVLV